MKLSCLFTLCLLTFPSFANADWVVMQEVEIIRPEMHMTNRNTIKIKGNKTRIDNDSSYSHIYDSDTGEQVTLIHEVKKFSNQSASKEKEAMEIIKKRMLVAPTNNADILLKLQATGERENIGGYDTEKYVWEGQGIKGSYWIAANFPNAAALNEALNKSGSSAMKSIFKNRLPDMTEVSGFPIRSEQQQNIAGFSPTLTAEQLKRSGVQQNQTSTNIVTVISAKEATLSDSEFVIPVGYTSMEARTTNAAADLRDVLKAMQKQGLSDSDRKQFENIINNSESQKIGNRQ